MLHFDEIVYLPLEDEDGLCTEISYYDDEERALFVSIDQLGGVFAADDEGLPTVVKKPFEDYRVQYTIFPEPHVRGKSLTFVNDKKAFDAIRQVFADEENVEKIIGKLDKLVGTFDFDNTIVTHYFISKRL